VIWEFFLLKIAPWLQKCAYFVSMEVNPNRYRSSKVDNWEILKISWIFTFFDLVVKVDLQAYKPCTIQFSIFKADAQVEDLKILKSCITKVFCDKHMQLLRPQGFWISEFLKYGNHSTLMINRRFELTTSRVQNVCCCLKQQFLL
jgi:hypothetical protein